MSWLANLDANQIFGDPVAGAASMSMLSQQPPLPPPNVIPDNSSLAADAAKQEAIVSHAAHDKLNTANRHVQNVTSELNNARMAATQEWNDLKQELDNLQSALRASRSPFRIVDLMGQLTDVLAKMQNLLQEQHELGMSTANELKGLNFNILVPDNSGKIIVDPQDPGITVTLAPPDNSGKIIVDPQDPGFTVTLAPTDIARSWPQKPK